MRSFALLGLVLCAACAAKSPMPLRHAPADGGQCRTTGLEVFRGQAVDQALAIKLVNASGAKTIRWVAPGTAVTMDFSPTRLTVRTDAQNRVESLSCG